MRTTIDHNDLKCAEKWIWILLTSPSSVYFWNVKSLLFTCKVLQLKNQFKVLLSTSITQSPNHLCAISPTIIWFGLNAQLYLDNIPMFRQSSNLLHKADFSTHFLDTPKIEERARALVTSISTCNTLTHPGSSTLGGMYQLQQGNDTLATILPLPCSKKRPTCGSHILMLVL